MRFFIYYHLYVNLKCTLKNTETMQTSIMPNLKRLLLSSILSLIALASAQANQPNILIFLVDDFGPVDLSVYGSDFYETPAMDQMAAEGKRFTQAYAAHPRCVPSRYGFFTGRFPVRDGCPGNTYNIAPEAITLAEALKDGGYRTFFAGKWHLGKKEGEMPEDQGFDINIAGGGAGAPRSYFAPYNKSKNKYHKAAKIQGLDDAPEGEFLTERLTEETIKFLKEHQASNSDQPFFAVLSHYSVHTPIEAKPEDEAYFEVKRGPRETEQFIERDGSTKVQQDNATYAAMIKSVDDSLNQVMQKLKALDLDKDTLVLLTSDHGGLSNRGSSNQRQLATSNLPFRAGKGHLYEGGIRVPFIVRWPQVVAAKTESDAIVTGTDVFATLLHAAGLPLLPEAHIDSVSLLPALKDEAFERAPIIWHSPRPRPKSTGDTAASAIRVGNMKLIKHYYPEVSYELYNVVTDIEENYDLSKQFPRLTEQLAHQLESQLNDLGAIAAQQQ